MSNTTSEQAVEKPEIEKLEDLKQAGIDESSVELLGQLCEVTAEQVANKQVENKDTAAGPLTMVLYGTEIEVLTLRDAESKASFALRCRLAAALVEATTSIFIAEAYLASQPGDSQEEVAANRKKYGSVADMPGSFEAVAINVQTNKNICVAGYAKILENTETVSGRSLGEFKWRVVDRVGGVFANILPKGEQRDNSKAND